MSRLNINKAGSKSKIGNIFYNHIVNNKREYFIVSILFFIGIIVGVLYINNTNETNVEEINTYFKNMVANIKVYEKIDYGILLKQSITSNFIMLILLWFGASTIVGIPIVYGSIGIKGFSIGYTISSIIMCFGTGKGIVLALSIMLLHNIIFIPAMLGASVSGVKLYQSIMKNKNRNNIKLEILRHTIFCTFMLVLMIISSLIEVYGSTNLFIMLLKRL